MDVDFLFEGIKKGTDLTVTFRQLRNICSENEEKRLMCQEAVKYCFQNLHLIKNNAIALQFIANATVSICNAQIFRESSLFLEDFLKTGDEKCINAIYMSIHNCFRHFDDFSLTDPFICCIVDNIQLEFPLIVAEDVVKGKGKFETRRWNEFLQIISVHTLVHPLISHKFLDQVVAVYKSKVDVILKSEITPETVELTQTVTELLSLVAPHHSYLQSDTSLLTSVLYFLKMAEESKHCEAKRSMEDLKSMGRQEGIVNLKSDLIKLLTSLCHENEANQNLAYECGVVDIILDNMRYDARNPFIREISIHCLKVLCKHNQKVQQHVSQLTFIKKLESFNLET